MLECIGSRCGTVVAPGSHFAMLRLAVGGSCAYTVEWDVKARQTYLLDMARTHPGAAAVARGRGASMVQSELSDATAVAAPA